MKKNQNGFSIVEILIVLVVVGLIGAAGWVVYNRQKTANNEDALRTSEAQSNNGDASEKNEGSEEKPVEDVKTENGINYPLISGWENAKQPFEPFGIGSGQYLLSPDYKEAGGGQLSIKSGASIHFQGLEWEGISSATSVDQAANLIKGSEGYLDASSVKVTEISGNRVITYDSGHTTDGVTALLKTSGNKWLETSFSTVAGDGGYSAQDSPHYKTYIEWLEKFVTLNK